MRAVLLSGLVTAALVLVAVGVFELSLERARSRVGPVVVFGRRPAWSCSDEDRLGACSDSAIRGSSQALRWPHCPPVGSLLGVKLPRE
jgi:hypothetical protein